MFKEKNVKKGHIVFRDKSLYRERSLKNAKQNMPEELYNAFCKEEKRILESWAILYDIALADPEAYKALDEKYGHKQKFKDLEDIVAEDCSDELKRRYVEAKQFCMHADEWYTKEYRFATRIKILVIDLIVLVNNAIQKQEQRKEHLKETNRKWCEMYASSPEISAKRRKIDKSDEEISFTDVDISSSDGKTKSVSFNVSAE